MNYKKLAYVYDHLMKDAPYQEWVDFTEQIIDQFHINPNKIVDLGCGTGNIAIPLMKKGHKVIGVDLSDEMLSIAYEKMLHHQMNFPLLQQDMREFELNEQVELIISYCDSLNYLSGIEDVTKAFQQVNKHLETEGYFLFDMHSPYKFTEVFHEETFAWDEGDIAVIWYANVERENLKVKHDITFFVEDDQGTYEKYNEQHQQKTYTIDVVKALLEQTGFQLIDTYSDFTLEPVHEETERIFYLAQKINVNY